MVVVAAEEVVHRRLGRGASRPARLVAAGGHGHQLVGGGEIGAVQLQHRGDEVGAVDLRRAQLRQVGAVAVEERVLKRGAQVGEGGGVVILGDVAPVDAIDLEEFQQTGTETERSFFSSRFT
jgi:hypothetical protein